MILISQLGVGLLNNSRAIIQFNVEMLMKIYEQSRPIHVYFPVKVDVICLFIFKKNRNTFVCKFL